MNNAHAILKTICEEYDISLTYSEAKWHLRELDNLIDVDFYLEIDGMEFRLIDQDAIWGIYVEEIRQVVEDCYDLKLDDIPDFVAFEVDWEQTAENAFADGFGHHFSGYDGSEYDAGDYYIFCIQQEEKGF